ncbi:Dps family protein [Micromonospora sp. HM5-17]|jgi:starvation-inducible DNA-binding protein|uniref:Dps family protein n=1 Tax=Micromonospora sp. HM5-17 TaxID=2487710 RepID=UPI000F4640BA|nr:DNA starvation/stationary phase protection protein [Micromonospora sp. HM5-17]ROT34222.1 DNA starvation/stationary phase protection protein [Micromonospora sp. HM5-17]
MANPQHADPFTAPETGDGRVRGSQPLLHQYGAEVQRFGDVRLFPIALSFEARSQSCQLLNHILADSIILYNLYKKHHWLVRGHTFYQLHLLLDKHAEEQLKLVDLMAERVQTLGGVAIADPRHVAEVTTIPRPPNGVEQVPAMLSRLLEAHEIVITKVRDAADRTSENGDAGTNDILVSDVLRTNELQVWFIAEHLVDVPATRIGSEV